MTEHITNEQLNRKLDEHIFQHNKDNESQKEVNKEILDQLKIINEIIAGAKMIPAILKFLLLVGGFLGMLFGLFKMFK